MLLKILYYTAITDHWPPWAGVLLSFKSLWYIPASERQLQVAQINLVSLTNIFFFFFQQNRSLNSGACSGSVLECQTRVTHRSNQVATGQRSSANGVSVVSTEKQGPFWQSFPWYPLIRHMWTISAFVNLLKAVPKCEMWKSWNVVMALEWFTIYPTKPNVPN